MWKYLINKEAFDALTPEMQAAYKAAGTSGNYVLNIDGMPDVDAMQGQIDTMTATLATADQEKAAAAAAARDKALKEARTTGDFASIEADYKAQIKALNTQLAGAAQSRRDDHFNSQVDKLAAELFGPYADYGRTKLLDRLKLEGGDETNPNFITRVLKDGQASAMSLDDLKSEFRANETFKPFLVEPGSSGTGSRRQQTPVIPKETGYVDPMAKQLTRAEQIAASIPAE